VLPGGELRHVRAGLGHDHVGGQRSDSWDGADQVVEAAKRFHDFRDPVGQLGDRGRVLIDEVQVKLGEEGVVLGEPADQCLGQPRDLRAHPSLC